MNNYKFDAKKYIIFNTVLKYISIDFNAHLSL